MFPGDCDGGALYISTSFDDSAILTLTNTDFRDNTASRNGGAVSAAREVILAGGTFQGNRAGGSTNSFVGGGGLSVGRDLNANGTRFIENSVTNKHGGGIVANLGPVSLTGCHFEGNSAVWGGGFAARNFTPTSIVDTDFIANVSEEQGGGVWTQFNGETLTVTRGQFVGNSTNIGDGGDAFSAGGADLLDVTFRNNVARDSGGGIFVQSGDLTLTGGIFETNRSDGDDFIFSDGGGGLQVKTGALDALGTLFDRNVVSAGSGGGAFVNGTATLRDVTFAGNESVRSGGGIYTSSAGLVATDCQFIGNVVLEGSGGGASSSTTVELTGSLFQGNRAEGDFGSDARVHASDGGTIDDCQFLGNQAVIGGAGAIHGESTVTDSLFHQNQSSSHGGALNGGFDTVTIIRSEFTENTAGTNGGATSILGTQNIDASVFRNNTSTTGDDGAVHTSSRAIITGSSEFTDNEAGLSGGGVFANSGLTATNARFEHNTSGANGGGFSAALGEFILANVLVQDNHAGGDGGGFYSGFRGTMNDGQVLGNTAVGSGGGLWFNNRGTLSGSIVAGNIAGLSGGGIYREARTTQEVTIEGCAIHTNEAGENGGGTYLLRGVGIELRNCTWSGNGAGVAGGGLYVGPETDLSLSNVTLAQNTAPSGPAMAAEDDTVTVRWVNTLAAGECAPAGASMTSLGGNIESSSDSCGFSKTSDQVEVATVDLALSPLASNGGLTPTHALLPNSVALDAGVSPCPMAHQRGLPRSDGLCDTGAYEAFTRERARGVFVRGDVDSSRAQDITDSINILKYLLLGTFDPTCLDALDVDDIDSGLVEITDAINQLSAIILGTFAVPPPATECGLDPTPDAAEFDGDLGCQSHVCPSVPIVEITVFTSINDRGSTVSGEVLVTVATPIEGLLEIVVFDESLPEGVDNLAFELVFAVDLDVGEAAIFPFEVVPEQVGRYTALARILTGDPPDLVDASDTTFFGVRDPDGPVLPDTLLAADLCEVDVERTRLLLENSASLGTPVSIKLCSQSFSVRIEEIDHLSSIASTPADLEGSACFEGVLLDSTGVAIPGSLVCFTVAPGSVFGMLKQLEDPGDPESIEQSIWVEPIRQFDAALSPTSERHAVYDLEDTLPPLGVGPAGGGSPERDPRLSLALSPPTEQDPGGAAGAAENLTVFLHVYEHTDSGLRSLRRYSISNFWAAMLRHEFSGVEPRESDEHVVTVVDVQYRGWDAIPETDYSTSNCSDDGAIGTCSDVLCKFQNDHPGEDNTLHVLFTHLGDGCGGLAYLGEGSATSCHSMTKHGGSIAYESMVFAQEVGHNLDWHADWSPPNHDPHTAAQISEAWNHTHEWWLFTYTRTHGTLMGGTHEGRKQPEMRAHRISETPLRHLAEGLYRFFGL